MDYAKELAEYGENISPEDKADLKKLSTLQKDIAVGGSAEDFVRHPFFKSFENHLNDVINDSKGKMAEILARPDVTLASVQAHQAGINAVKEIKQWINSQVVKKRVAEEAIRIYEQETEDLNLKVQEAIDKSIQS